MGSCIAVERRADGFKRQIYKGHSLPELKILHVIPTLAPTSGGPTQVLLDLLKSTATSGCRVAVCTTDRGNPTTERLPESYFITLFSGAIDSHIFPVTLYLPLFSPLMRVWLKQNIQRYDLVHIHSLYRFPVTYAAWLARKTGVPYIIRPHGSLDPFLYRQCRFGKVALPLKRMYERFFDIPNLNHAGAIHYTTREEAERASFLGLRAKPVIVPNGIDWESYAELPTKGDFRKRLGMSEQTPLILFLGRINFKKGLDLLVPVFAFVAKRVPLARLAIVGPDNEGYGLKVRRWCREQGIADKVIFVDHLGPEQVKQAYVDADVFVLPSYTENFGMTVVEAMACGCPVVISDQVNIWREVQEEGAGVVVGLDPPQIADAICRVLGDKDAAKKMGRRGRRAAQRRYGWPRIVEQMTQVYRGVIEASAGRRRMKP